MFELHIANKNYSSWSLRPWLLMKALAIPFTETMHFFTALGTPNGFAKVSPTTKLPLLVDGEQRIWDSLAITEYLAESYPQVWPTDKDARAWARSMCAEMHSGFSALRNECSMNIGVRICLHAISPGLQTDLLRLETMWTDSLNRFKGPWLLGEKFTAADAFFGPVAFRCRTYGIELSEPAQSYLERLLNHPAMIEWQQQALQERVRDESHELEAGKYGKVTHDFRVQTNLNS